MQVFKSFMKLKKSTEKELNHLKSYKLENTK